MRRRRDRKCCNIQRSRNKIEVLLYELYDAPVSSAEARAHLSTKCSLLTSCATSFEPAKNVTYATDKSPNRPARKDVLFILHACIERLVVEF